MGDAQAHEAELLRLQAGRIHADLATLTADVAAVFRSAATSTGLAYPVDGPDLANPCTSTLGTGSCQHLPLLLRQVMRPGRRW
jgi:hypothetical protein